MSRNPRPPRIDHLGARPRRTPLGNPYPQRPEAGPPVARYYDLKARRGETGTYDALHETPRVRAER